MTFVKILEYEFIKYKVYSRSALLFIWSQNDTKRQQNVKVNIFEDSRLENIST